MASVYKSISKTGNKDPKDGDGTKKNKQRVLVLTSRGVTYRFVLHSGSYIQDRELITCANNADIAIFLKI